MKKLLVSTVVLALASASMISFAQSSTLDHSSHGQPGLSQAEKQNMRQEMQKKMSAATTDEERQGVMTAQRKSMQEKYPDMKPMHPGEHRMGDMGKSPMGDRSEHQPMMQKQNGMMPITKDHVHL